jgi:hypothetical protein
MLLELPNWVAVMWMIVWAFLGYIFAPYGMWKHHRAQIDDPRIDLVCITSSVLANSFKLQTQWLLTGLTSL